MTMLARRRFLRGYTLIEMLTTVAILIVVLGLMVSLARDVRYRSAQQLTKDVLRRLDVLTRAYREREGHLPRVPPIIEPGQQTLDEGKIRTAARQNNAKLVEALKGEIARSGLQERERSLGGSPPAGHDPGTGFGDLPISLFDGRTIADAWGNPIVFMAQQHPAIGMATIKRAEDGEAFFFFSPGPDGKFLTRDDNLYSYEQAGQ